MTGTIDWQWKIREAIERIRTRYEHIGRKTGAPFLAVVYPPEVERASIKEWRAQTSALETEFDLRIVNVLDIVMNVTTDFGAENIVASINDPMPGSNPEPELGAMWVSAVAEAVRAQVAGGQGKRLVIVLEGVAALHPAAGPRSVMERLWESEQSSLEGPVVVLIPGTLIDRRTYKFLDRVDEFMYRGDIL